MHAIRYSILIYLLSMISLHMVNLDRWSILITLIRLSFKIVLPFNIGN